MLPLCCSSSRPPQGFVPPIPGSSLKDVSGVLFTWVVPVLFRVWALLQWKPQTPMSSHSHFTARNRLGPCWVTAYVLIESVVGLILSLERRSRQTEETLQKPRRRNPCWALFCTHPVGPDRLHYT